MRESVAVVGLGSMGFGVASSLIRAGFATYGVDLNQQVLDRLSAAGAADVGTSANQFAAQLDAVIVIVVNAKQVKSILFGDHGLAPQLRAGTPVIVCSTMAAKDAQEIATQLATYNLPMLDAPVSGGAAKALVGQMTIMASGDPELFVRLDPILNAIAAKVYNIGPEIGKGSTVKVIHQLLAGVHIAVGAEAMALAAKANIPLDLMYDVVTNAAGNSWMFENRMKHVVEGDYTPLSMVDIFVKDLGLVADTASELEFTTPLAAQAFAMFKEASALGYGKLDDSAVIKIFPGITLPSREDKE